MEWKRTQVVDDPMKVDARLAELGLHRAGLLAVRDVALAAAANVTRFHAANAWGTFAYHEGVRSLREQFVGKVWIFDARDGVEGIYNKDLNIRVAYSNVDIAGKLNNTPRPRSGKGAGVEKLCTGNLFGESLPHFTPVQKIQCPIYYLLVDENGACELSSPVVANKTFSSYIEQILLSDGSDHGPDALDFGTDDAVTDFNPVVVRKS